MALYLATLKGKKRQVGVRSKKCVRRPSGVSLFLFWHCSAKVKSAEDVEFVTSRIFNRDVICRLVRQGSESTRVHTW